MEILFVRNGSCLSGAKGSVYDKHRLRTVFLEEDRPVRKFRGIISVSFAPRFISGNGIPKKPRKVLRHAVSHRWIVGVDHP